MQYARFASLGYVAELPNSACYMTINTRVRMSPRPVPPHLIARAVCHVTTPMSWIKHSQTFHPFRKLNTDVLKQMVPCFEDLLFLPSAAYAALLLGTIVHDVQAARSTEPPNIKVV